VFAHLAVDLQSSHRVGVHAELIGGQAFALTDVAAEFKAVGVLIRDGRGAKAAPT
jgi:hypothetical protein